MRRMYGLLAVPLLLLWALPVAAQTTGTVTGRVTHRVTNQPIVGAQVFLAGTTRGGLTGQDGRYLLPNVTAGAHEIRVTMIGYGQASQRITVAAGQTEVVDFELAESAVELGAVVVAVTGQQQTTRQMGNVVGQIRVEDVDLGPVTNMTALLQARAPGVTVTPASGTTGAAQRIRIRGANSISLSNEPLLIIDGMRANMVDGFTNVSVWQSPSRLNDINPDDIESIEILKGPAAAALYGTAAANGVIQVTTRRGRVGPARWSFYTEQTRITDPTNWPASFRSETGCILWDVADGFCDPEDVAPGQLYSFNPLTDPRTSPFKNGYRGKYGLSVSGGTDAVQYYVSGDYEGEDGIYQFEGINTNELRRLNLRTNVDARLSDRLNLGLRLGYVTSDLTLPDNDNSLYGVLLNGLLGSGSIDIDEGTYGIPFRESFQFDAAQEANRFTGGFSLNYRPLEWLSFVGSTGLDRVSRHDNEYVGAGRISPIYSSLITQGYRRSNRVDVMNLTSTLSGTATYRITDQVQGTTSFGTQYHIDEYADTRAFGRGVAPGTKSLKGVSSLFAIDENHSDIRTFSAFGQHQFALSDRFFLTGALRGDDNSAFGTGTGFVFYPSVSASWVLSEEPFFPELPVLSNLRLRSAWGQSGLRPTFRDAITYFTPVSVRVQGQETPAVTLAGTGNPDLRPEVSTEIEVGFDLGAFEDRVGLGFTYYHKRSEDALVERRLPPSLGLTTSRWENIGSVRNSGIETTINARLLDMRQVRWELNASYSTNNNELTSLAEGIDPILLGSDRNRQRHVPGFPLGGYWQRPVSWNDENNDGLLNSDEVMLGDTAVYLGSPLPTREATWSSAITLFERVRISGLFDYRGGHKQLNFTRFDRCAWEILCQAAYDPNNTTLRDQAGIIAFNYLDPGTNTAAFLEESDFVKFRELSVSFLAPAEWTQGLGVNNVRLTLSGRNLATWTKYEGFDPEVNSFGIFSGAGGFQQMDYYTQPPLRYWVARFDFNF
jgi:TonB-dependent starch-binding outer membrane protein SusC